MIGAKECQGQKQRRGGAGSIGGQQEDKIVDGNATRIKGGGICKVVMGEAAPQIPKSEPKVRHNRRRSTLANTISTIPGIHANA